MNRVRRKKINEVFNQIEEAKKQIEEVKNEEQYALDHLPQSFQYGARGDDMQAYIEMLDEAFEFLDDANSVIEQI